MYVFLGSRKQFLNFNRNKIVCISVGKWVALLLLVMFGWLAGWLGSRETTNSFQIYFIYF